MTYFLLFYEFFKIGLFAVGGGLVTVPFLFDLAEKYPWFTPKELADMIAVSQSTPGPVGINMATFAGFKAAGVSGALIATFGEILPSMIVIYFIAEMLSKWQNSKYVQTILQAIRPAALALILAAAADLMRITLFADGAPDYKSIALAAGLLALMRLYKTNVVFYIIVAAVTGILFKL